MTLNDWYGTKDKQMNKAVLASMPKNPKPGSYWWWARLCREYSGQNMLDSGGAYGRMHGKPMPGPDSPTITITSYNGEFEYATVSLPHWLSKILDGADEKAMAFDKVLRWASDNLWPREEWGQVIKDFLSLLDGIVEECYMTGDERDDWFSRVSLQEVLEAEGFENVKELAKKFPRDAFMKLGGESWTIINTGYTYNNDNSFSQDFIWTLLGPESRSRNDMYDAELCIVRTHNGCDARSGFSSPQVGGITDMDYFFDFEVSLYGSNSNDCDDYESCYGYYEAMKKAEFPNIEELMGFVMRYENGTPLPGFDKPEFPMSPTLVRALFKEYERQRSEHFESSDEEFGPDDFNWPHFVIGNDENGYEFPEESGYGSYDAMTVSLWSPNLQRYCLYCDHPVNGW